MIGLRSLGRGEAGRNFWAGREAGGGGQEAGVLGRGSGVVGGRMVRGRELEDITG